MFRKYSEQGLLDLDDWWWLITPYAGISDYARYVNADGALLYGDAYGSSLGVRPAFMWNLKSKSKLKGRIQGRLYYELQKELPLRIVAGGLRRGNLEVAGFICPLVEGRKNVRRV